MTSTTTEPTSFDQVMDAFLARIRRGERPSIAEYAQKYPQWADEIHE